MAMHCAARRLYAVAAFLTVISLPAQGAESTQTIDRIIGSPVQHEAARSDAEAGKITTAIERTRENIGTVRKTSKLDKVDIVFLIDAARSEGGPPPAIEDKVRQHQHDITELRKEIEANALLFTAIKSQRVLAQDVLAVDFDDPGTIVIYAAAKPTQ